MKCKENNPLDYDYIADDFIIVIKQAEDFKFEITKTIRESLTDKKLNLAVCEVEDPDWSQCSCEKIANIKRKVQAVMNIDESDKSLNEIVETYAQAYIKGTEILKLLRISYAEIYEDVMSLIKVYKKQVSLKTAMNIEQTMNSKIFNEILKDFENKLEASCKYFTPASIIELKIDIISMWLADCSLKFRK